MSLCSICDKLSFSELPTVLPEFSQHLPVREEILTLFVCWSASNSTKNDRSYGLRHHQSREALKASAQSCRLCDLIMTGYSETLQTYQAMLSTKHQKHLAPVGEPNGDLWLCKSPNSSQNGFWVMSPGSVDRQQVWLVAAIEFCVEYDNPLSSKIHRRPIDPDPLGVNAVSLMRAWINECSKERGYTEPLPTEKPARLVDVGDTSISTDRVVLKNYDDSTDTYVGLSHCWGSLRRKEYLTTKATLGEKMKQGFAIAALPQTIRDAITLTRKLNLRYIWIDSLCICQDDKLEWQNESAKMAGVYSQALFTIAASCSSHDTLGFLNLRPERKTIRLSHSVDGMTGTVLAFLVPKHYAAHEDHYVKMQDEPLSQRAWALQERYLSRNVLHFGSSQISFESKTRFVTEDGYLHPKPPDLLGQGKDSILHMSSDKFDHVIGIWGKIVGEYSRRKLSVPSDKLPALAGLAKRFSDLLSKQNISSEYLAGLWQHNVVEELVWDPFGHGKPVTQYRAPSWSWLSIEGEVTLNDLPFEDSERMVKVIDAEVHREGKNPFGEVSAGFLRLEGILLTIKLTQPVEHKEGSPTWGLFTVPSIEDVDDETADDNYHGIRFDSRWEDVANKPGDADLFILPLMFVRYKSWFRTSAEDRIKCLVLQRHNENGKVEVEEDLFVRMAVTTLDGSLKSKILARKQTESRTITLI